MWKQTSIFVGISLTIIAPQALAEWTDLNGGDHQGQNWTPPAGAIIAGDHYNIGIFSIPAGQEVRVAPFDGTNFGWVRIAANTSIHVQGSLNGDGRGFSGGAGGSASGEFSAGGLPGRGPGSGIAGQNSSDVDGESIGRPGAGGGGAAAHGGSGGRGGQGGCNSRSCTVYAVNGASARTYGTIETDDFQLGSGGGGGGAGGASAAACGGPGTSGVVGGRGGGAIWLEVASQGDITISGTVTTNGDAGGAGGAGKSPAADCDADAGGGGAGGGGASGGTILLKGGNIAVLAGARVQAMGGSGGAGGRGGTHQHEAEHSASGAGGGAGGGGGRIKIFAGVYSADGSVRVDGGAAGMPGENGTGAPCSPGRSGSKGSAGSVNPHETWDDPYLRTAAFQLMLSSDPEHMVDSLTLEPSRHVQIPLSIPLVSGSLEATEAWALGVQVTFDTPTGAINCTYARGEPLSHLPLISCGGGLEPGDFVEVLRLTARLTFSPEDAYLVFRPQFFEKYPMLSRQPPQKFLTYEGTNLEILPGEYMVVFDGADVSESSVSSLATSLVAGTSGVVDYIFTKSMRGFSVNGVDDAWATTVSNRSDVKWVRKNLLLYGSEMRGGVFNPVPYNLDRVDQLAPFSLDRDYRLKTGSLDPDPNTVVPVIYVLDNGINGDHADFTVSGANSRVQNVADFRGTNFARCAADNATAGHGTAVAAVAAGDAHGIAPQALIKNIVVTGAGVRLGLPTCISGSLSDVAKGLDAAYKDILNRNYSRAIVNLSLGTTGSAPDVEVQVQNLLSRGAVVVAAASNENIDAASTVPANIPGVLAIGATNMKDERWTGPSQGSNFGNTLTMWAPGHNIISADWVPGNNGATTTSSGTSLAAPHVAGALALFLLQDRTISPNQAVVDLRSRATYYMLSGLGAGSPNLLLYLGEGAPRPVTGHQMPVAPAKNERLNAASVSYDGALLHLAGGEPSATGGNSGPYSASGFSTASLGAGPVWSIQQSSDALKADCVDVDTGNAMGQQRAFYACMATNGGVRQPGLIARDPAGGSVWSQPVWLAGNWMGGLAFDANDADFFNPRVFVIAQRNKPAPQVGQDVFVSSLHAVTGNELHTVTLSGTGFGETYHAPLDLVFDGANVIAATYSDDSDNESYVWKLDPETLQILDYGKVPVPTLSVDGVIATALGVQPLETNLTNTIPAEVFLAAQIAVSNGHGGTDIWSYLYRLDANRTGIHSSIDLVKETRINSIVCADGDVYFAGTTRRTFPPGSLAGTPKAGTKDDDAFLGKNEGVIQRRRWIRSFNTTGTVNNYGRGAYGNERGYLYGSDYSVHYVNEYLVY